MKISPWLNLAIRISTAVLAVIITAAQGSPEHFGGKIVADDLSFYLGLIVSIGNVVFSFVGTGIQPSQTLVGKIA